LNIYEKIQKIKVDLLNCDLKRSGENKFAGFKYYQLKDFMPDVIKLCDKYKVCTVIKFGENFAELSAIDTEIQENNEYTKITITAPTVDIDVPKGNKMQALGGIQTYIRRYLFMALFDIVEDDQFDAVSGKNQGHIKLDKDYFCDICHKKFENVEYNGKFYSSKSQYEASLKKSSDKIARCKNCRENVEKEDK